MSQIAVLVYSRFDNAISGCTVDMKSVHDDGVSIPALNFYFVYLTGFKIETLRLGFGHDRQDRGIVTSQRAN